MRVTPTKDGRWRLEWRDRGRKSRTFPTAAEAKAFGERRAAHYEAETVRRASERRAWQAWRDGRDAAGTGQTFAQQTLVGGQNLLYMAAPQYPTDDQWAVLQRPLDRPDVSVEQTTVARGLTFAQACAEVERWCR